MQQTGCSSVFSFFPPNSQYYVLSLIHGADQLGRDGFIAEDDTSIPSDVKVPILIAFHRHIYDREWHFACECLGLVTILSSSFFCLDFVEQRTFHLFHSAIKKA